MPASCATNEMSARSTARLLITMNAAAMNANDASTFAPWNAAVASGDSAKRLDIAVTKRWAINIAMPNTAKVAQSISLG